MTIPKEKNETTPEEISYEIESDEDSEEHTRKCLEIGDDLSKLISSDVNKLRCKNQIGSLQELNNFDVIHWLSSRPTELLPLICKLCNFDINCDSNKKATIVAKVIELIYYRQASKLVLQNHFLENILCYSFTNCKSYLNLQGSRFPGGAYTFIIPWLKELAQDPTVFPQGLVKVVFDNCQKVGKTYAITGTNIVPTV